MGKTKRRGYHSRRNLNNLWNNVNKPVKILIDPGGTKKRGRPLKNGMRSVTVTKPNLNDCLRGFKRNLPKGEQDERSLISAVKGKQEIPIPSVEIIDSVEYDSLYPVVFENMPQRVEEGKCCCCCCTNDDQADEEKTGNSERSDNARLEELRVKKGEPLPPIKSKKPATVSQNCSNLRCSVIDINKLRSSTRFPIVRLNKLDQRRPDDDTRRVSDKKPKSSGAAGVITPVVVLRRLRLSELPLNCRKPVATVNCKTGERLISKCH